MVATATAAVASPIHVSLKAEVIGYLFNLPITNSLLMTWLVMVILITFAFFFGRSLKLIPGRFQTLIEWLLMTIKDFVYDTLGNEKLARIFFPLVATIFLFILVGNELEFFPGIGSIGFLDGTTLTPLLRAPAADLNFTLALAAIAFMVIEVTGIMTIGAFKYAGKFLNFRSPLTFSVGIIELVSELARLLSFSFRLFGNIFAGEVLVLVMGSFFSVLLPVPFIAFEVLVGFIQAAIFALLTLFFAKIAIEMDEAAHASGEDAPAHAS